jgi:predicted transcriptional regulator
LTLGQRSSSKLNLLYKSFGKILKIQASYKPYKEKGTMQKIIIIKKRRTPKASINDALRWIGTSLGLFSLRDRNSSCFRIFIVLLKKAKLGKVISSDEIAYGLGLTRGTVVHHLNMLIGTGLVLREKEGYILRESSLEKLMREIHRDINRQFEDIVHVARDIDQKLD